MNFNVLRAVVVAIVSCWAASMGVAFASSTELSDVPLTVANTVKPNVLAIFDNSESMDAYMAGTLVTGTDPNTRGNIGRRVLRNSVTRYRANFNWGLMSYALQDQYPGLYYTYAYFMGDPTTMNFTSDCVGASEVTHTPGVSASNGGIACTANPQPFTGGEYVTYGLGADDPSILDVLYIGWNFSALWAYDGSGACFNSFFNHDGVNSWDPGTFNSGIGTLCYTPTDAGFTATNPPYPRQFYKPRGFGYLSNITGGGALVAAVTPDVSGAPYPTLMAAIADETLNSYSADLKNAALFTPLQGTLRDARTYFQSGLRDVNGANQNSPISSTCQRNYVMLVTDGAPTGQTDGNLYSAPDRTNTYNAMSGTWAFGAASSDAIGAVSALRSTTYASNTYDVITYVIGLGDTVQNPSAVATLNAMAAAGGTTSAYLATDEAALTASLDAVTQDIIARDGSAAAVTVSNPNVVPGDNSSYESTYNSGSWTGDLKSYPINVTTGVIDHASPNWPASASAQLDTLTATNRMIATYDGSQGIQFEPSGASTATKLSPSQEAVFNTPPSGTDAAAVIAYLRGDRSAEGTTYRVRAHLLGDLVDAEPVLVRAPGQSYADPCYATVAAGCTVPFKTAQNARTRVVFQGSNDGMLHAFSAATGAELWAYVPKLVWPSLNLLTRLTGFTHLYRVDGTPVTGDADFSATYGSATTVPDWRTMLVGGLGKGGRGVYALDVTNPVAANEADVASKVLWEFPNTSTSTAISRNLGYTYGRPVLTKTAATGWVVLVASGYNNDSATSGGDGQGHLFVLNAKTGAVIRDISTGVGTPSSPSGLARISGFSSNAAVNNTVDYAYGGDLFGNVWRFDLTDADPTNWGVTKLATLVDGSGQTQPVTGEPQLSEITRNGISHRFVYVGTGEYLGGTDINTTQVQTMYGLIDDLSAVPLIYPLRANLVQQTISVVNATERQLSTTAIDYTTQRGWYVDLLLSSGERINTDPQLASGALLFTSNIPSSDLCVPGGSSWFYAIDYETGGIVANTTEPRFSAVFLGNALASRPSLVQLPNGRLVGAVHLSDGSSPTEVVPVAAAIGSGRRVFWKEVKTN